MLHKFATPVVSVAMNDVQRARSQGSVHGRVFEGDHLACPQVVAAKVGEDTTSLDGSVMTTWNQSWIHRRDAEST